jgi:SAM-dependent methyltransferase
MKDLFGKAILDYQTGNSPEDLITETTISEADEMSVAYLFRDYAEMPAIEQKALALCKGRILDVGCGAGSHSLYLQKQGKDVNSIDISAAAVEACTLRGIKKVRHINLLDLNDEKYDTVLLLMNGIGICGRIDRLPDFFKKLRSLINNDGQILLDSSDIIYMFDEDEDGGKWIPPGMSYYGELTFNISYKGESEDPFDWLYLDYNTLQTAAADNGLNCELVFEGEHYDFLARLTPLTTNTCNFRKQLVDSPVS